MKFLPEQIASVTRSKLLARGESSYPRRATIDSGESGVGDLFFGLRGEQVDGGQFAAEAIDAGAWGVVVAPEHAAELDGAWIFAASDPLAGLQALARGWRRTLAVPT